MATAIGSERNVLRSHIDSLLSAGGTEEGRAWCIKALHPCEPTIENVGMPDGNPTDTVRLSLNYTVPVSLPTATANWDCDITLMGHPTFPLCISTIGTGGGDANFLVPMFGGTPDTAVDTLAAQFTAWRLTYCSVTGHLDANATTDSGNVVAAQFPLRPTAALFGGRAAEGYFHAVPVVLFGKPPTYDQLMAMPRAYQNNLRAGFYMPLKLSNTSQHWRNVSESFCEADEGTVTWDSWANAHLASVATYPWPFPSVSCARINAGVLSSGKIASMCNDYAGMISIKNVAPSSSIVLKLRVGLECRVRPASPQTPFLRPPASYDPFAIQQYLGVVVQLADCYPAEWNDGGKLLAAISRGLKAISAPLSAVPGYGMALGPLASGLGTLSQWGSDAMKEGGGKRRKKKKSKARQQQQQPQQPKAKGKQKKPKVGVFVDANGKTHTLT